MSVKSNKDLAGLKAIGKIVGLVLREMAAHVRPGITTAELDTLGARVLAEHGARSAPPMVYGFPGTVPSALMTKRCTAFREAAG